MAERDTPPPSSPSLPSTSPGPASLTPPGPASLLSPGPASLPSPGPLVVSLPSRGPASLSSTGPASLPSPGPQVASLPSPGPQVASLPSHGPASLSSTGPASLSSTGPAPLPPYRRASLPPCLPASLPPHRPASLPPHWPASLAPSQPASLRPASLAPSQPASLAPSQPASLRPASLTSPRPASLEASWYYAGLPSSPKLVTRTSTLPWKASTGPEAYPTRKEISVVGEHAIAQVWEDNLALKLHAILNSKEVKWTSTDVVRIGIVGEPAPVILWIGVLPNSLSSDDGIAVACECKNLLEDFKITDVHVEIRESVVTRLAGPALLEPTYSTDPTVNFTEPLSTALGLPISTQITPWAEGTGGIFIREGGQDTKRLLLLTARHVIFKPDRDNNETYEYKPNDQPRHNVILFGNNAFEKFLSSIQAEIRRKAVLIPILESQIKSVEGKDNPKANKDREQKITSLGQAREAETALNTFHNDILEGWGNQESRVLGHAIFSPPIGVGVGTEDYTEDFAIIEVDPSKVNNFRGNTIDLGTLIPPEMFCEIMQVSTYPDDRLLKLQGIISDDEMRHPPMMDTMDSPCLMVLKRGSATGLTIGRANNIVSYVQYYYEDNIPATSKVWCIASYNQESGPFSGSFSRKGDSGSVVVDGLGRIGGIITGGSAGASPSTDLTFATPISFLLKRIQDYGFKVDL